MVPNRKLRTEIDQMQQLLANVIQAHSYDLQHPNVLEISKKLDLLISRYHGGLSFSLNVQPNGKDCSYKLQLDGILDYSTVDLLDRTIENLKNLKSLTIDFSGLKFIDSTGIGAILRVIHLAKDKGIQIEFEAFDEAVRESFETIGIVRVMEALLKRMRKKKEMGLEKVNGLT